MCVWCVYVCLCNVLCKSVAQKFGARTIIGEVSGVIRSKEDASKITEVVLEDGAKAK